MNNSTVIALLTVGIVVVLVVIPLLYYGQKQGASPFACPYNPCDPTGICAPGYRHRVCPPGTAAHCINGAWRC
jgi:hypothetical protein